MAEELTKVRSQLTNLLWDFEDYIESDTFEAAKFKELQDLDREVAPKVYNILITMKLDAPNPYLSQLSPPSSPHPPAFSPVQPTPQHPFGLGFNRGSGSVSGSQGDARSVAEFPTVEDATAQFRTLMSDRQLSSSHGHRQDSGLAVQTEEIPPEQPMPEPPRPPSLDPWDPQKAPYSDDGRTDNDSPVGRRPTVYRPESPIDPAISPMSPDNRHRQQSISQMSSGGSVTGGSESDSHLHDDYRHSGSSTFSNPANAVGHGTRPRAHTLSPTILEEEPPPRRSSNPGYVPQLQVRPPVPPIPLAHRKPSGPLPTSGVEDMDRQYQIRQQPQGQPPNAPLPAPPSRNNSSTSDAAWSPRSSTPKSQPGLEVAPRIPQAEMDTGLIPVESEGSDARLQASLSQRDCTIGPGSTFYLYKGFCDGAKEVLHGDIGVKKTKKPVSTCLNVARHLRITHIVPGVCRRNNRRQMHRLSV